MTEQVSDAEFLLGKLRNRIHDAPLPAEYLLDASGNAIEALLRKLGELEAALEYYANSIGDHGIRARAVLSGDNAQWLIDRENEMRGANGK